MVDSHGFLIQDERRPYVRGPNRLIEDKSGLRLSQRLERLISQRLFDRGGHTARHGRAEEGHRTYALLAAAALCGWLDTSAGSDLLGDLGNEAHGGRGCPEVVRTMDEAAVLDAHAHPDVRRPREVACERREPLMALCEDLEGVLRGPHRHVEDARDVVVRNVLVK